MKAILIEGNHEYNLIEQENFIMLYYSESEHWNSNTKGQLALGLENDGNGFKIIGGLAKKNRIDYSESIELLILLSAVKESKIEIFEKVEEL
jgi:hypothetical protein